jgi:hypothetical protein
MKRATRSAKQRRAKNLRRRRAKKRATRSVKRKGKLEFTATRCQHPPSEVT